MVDTTELTPRELRKTIAEQFADQEQAQSFRIEVMSFGFKYGIPIDADLVFDVRFFTKSILSSRTEKPNGCG